MLLSAAASAASLTVPGDPALGPDQAAWSKAASIAVLPSGRLWVAYCAGTGGFEGIALSYSDNPAKGVWTDPAATLSDAGETYGSPVLYADADGGLCLFYTASDGTLYRVCCPDPSATLPGWTPPQVVGRGTAVSAPVRLPDGGLVLAVAREGEGAMVLSGTADGSAWTEGPLVEVPGKVPGRHGDPVLYAGADGSLHMVLRSCGTAQNYVSRSSDGGRSWSRPERFSLHPDRTFSLAKTPSGQLLYARDARIDQTTYDLLRGLFLYVSGDDGRSWYGGLSLDRSEKADSPRVAVGPQGRVYVVYNEDEEGLGRTLLVTTGIDEVAASTPWHALAARNRSVLRSPARAKERVAAENKALTVPGKSWGRKPLRVATYNIQYINPLWKERRKALADLFGRYAFDVVGVQEPTLVQIEDMMADFGGAYDWVGTCVTGDNTTRNAHFVPVFYRRDRLELLDWDTVWLSERPVAPGYDSYDNRMLVWVRFRDKETDEEFFLFNTHLAWKGEEAREVSAHILVDAVRRIAGNRPAFCTGDFNCDEASRPYQVILGIGFLQDSMEAVSDPENVEYFSMSNYKPMSTVARNRRHIDHIFYNPASVRVFEWKLITDDFNGMFGSDHLPIVIGCRIADISQTQ